MSYYQWLGAIEIGVIYALVTLAVYLSFKVIDFADLTVDGSFVVGSAVFAKTLIQTQSLFIALFFAFIASALCGLITVFIAHRLKMPSLLASIIVMTGLYSISMRILGQPNLVLFNLETSISPLVLIYGVVGFFILFHILLLKTEFGLSFFAIGKNTNLAGSFTIPVFLTTAFVMSLSNGLVGVAGALQTYYQGFVDITMGVGTVIVGFATVILAEKLYSKDKVFWIILSCVAASILYRMVISFALSWDYIGIKSSDINVITSLIIISIIYFNKKRLKNA